jgi:hypothetical protein
MKKIILITIVLLLGVIKSNAQRNIKTVEFSKSSQSVTIKFNTFTKVKLSKKKLGMMSYPYYEILKLDTIKLGIKYNNKIFLSVSKSPLKEYAVSYSYIDGCNVDSNRDSSMLFITGFPFEDQFIAIKEITKGGEKYCFELTIYNNKDNNKILAKDVFFLKELISNLSIN